MDNIEVAKKIAQEVINELCNEQYLIRDEIRHYEYPIQRVVEGVVLKNLNDHYQTQSVPAVLSLPTTCDEPGIAY